MVRKKKESQNTEVDFDQDEDVGELTIDDIDDDSLESNLYDSVDAGDAVQVTPLDESYLTEMDKILGKINKEFKKAIKSCNDHLITYDENLMVFPTGNPILDIYTGGGIPENRMTYLYGKTLTGKTTLAFQMCTSIFRRSFIKGTTDQYKYIFLDAEEGEAREWIDRIGTKFPYGEPLVPKSIEIIEEIFLKMRKKYPDKKLVAIWDSVASTKPDSITGRGDIARAVSSLMNHISFTDLGLTMIAINQWREKQDQYAPEPNLPGGNTLKHKSHLTLFSPGSSDKSKFFKNPTKLGKDVTWRVKKSRVGFNNNDFNLELTYHSGFDSIIPFILKLKDFDILYRKDDKPIMLVNPGEVEFKWKGMTKGKSVIEKQEVKKITEITDLTIPNQMIFSNYKDLYKFFLTKESYPYWLLGLHLVIWDAFGVYFDCNEQFDKFRFKLHDVVASNYFSDDMFDRYIPTKYPF